jgi:hypothetical protein
MLKIELCNIDFKEKLGANSGSVKFQIGVEGFRNRNSCDLKSHYRGTETEKKKTENSSIEHNKNPYLGGNN